MPIVIPPPIVKPFCNSGSQVSPPAGTDTIVANQEIGFPPLQATPLSSGGKPVNIQQLNGLLKFYTQQIQALVSGAQFTFDQAVSDENGGYPQGVILFDSESGTFQKSLVDNNTANFLTNRSYLNDEIHWSGNIYAESLFLSKGGRLRFTSSNSNTLDLSLPSDFDNNYNIELPSSFPSIPYGAIALASVNAPPNVSTLDWVPLPTRITYALTSSAGIPPNNFIKFDTLYNTFNLQIPSPYDPTTGLFTAPEDAIYKFEVGMSLSFSGPGQADLSLYTATPTFISSITDLIQSDTTSYGAVYVKLNLGDQIGLYNNGGNPTITPIIGGIANQLTISWHV